MDNRSKGQVEDTITKRAISFYRESIGTGPEKARTYIIEDMIIVRLQGELMPVEKKLLRGKKGVEIIKHLRQNLHDSNIGDITRIIKEITGQTVISSHTDISTKTGEIFEVFILEDNFEKKLIK